VSGSEPPVPTPPGRPSTRPPASTPDARFSGVDADMTDIFAGLPPAKSRAARGGRGPAVWWPWGLAVLLLVGLALIGRGWRPPTAPVASPVPVASTPPSPAVPPEAAPPAPLPVPEPQAPPRPERAGPPSAKPRTAAPPTPAVAHAARKRSAGRPGASGPAAVAAATPAEAHDAPTAVADCPAGYAAWCLRDRTNAADRDLRQAYQAAIEAGVKGGTLRGVWRQWVRYRRLANSRPEELIRGYDGLTRRLRDLRSTGAEGGSHD